MSDRRAWDERHRARPERAAPSPFVAAHVAAVARRHPGAWALDVACGSGRHAALLAEHGLRTIAIDHAASACRRVALENPGVAALIGDASALPLRDASFAVIVQTLFLERAILGDLLRLLARGGLLLAETFLVAQHEATGHPRRAFCLEPGELAALCLAAASGVEIVAAREGFVPTAGGGAHLASIAVCKV
jgi:SAM-dependent methyltransferase